MDKIEKNFDAVINKIKQDINKTQLDIMISSNISLVNLYYRIGKVLYENSIWGNKFLDKLALDLKISYPNQKGFSIRNLKYMKTFYSEYYSNSEFVHLGAQLPWKHNISLIEKVKDKNIRKWYMEKCIIEGWSKNVLLYQIESNLYQRQKKNPKLTNFNKKMSVCQSELANDILKDPYIFELTNLKDRVLEVDIENAMIEKIKNILLEFGKGFSFVGSQYKIITDNCDYYIDLLFYHLELRCYIVVELKNTVFKPEYIGQLNFYVTAINKKIKKDCDNETIGLLLCKEKDKISVEWALEGVNNPIGVSSYEIEKYFPKRVLEKLPTEEEFNIYVAL